MLINQFKTIEKLPSILDDDRGIQNKTHVTHRTNKIETQIGGTDRGRKLIKNALQIIVLL